MELTLHRLFWYFGIRYLVAGRHIVYASLRTSAVSRGQRFGDIDDDHGLQVYDASARFDKLSTVDITHAGT